MNDNFAVIGGSGAYELLKNEGFGVDLECRKIITPFGESASIHRFKSEAKASHYSFLFISRHGETGYEISAPFVNYRANIWALKECGVERIISWSGPGIINKKYSVGDFVIPHDIIDETRGREYTFFGGTGIGFIRQSHPFCSEIRDAVSAALEATRESYHNEGVYVCTQGPRLETAAEIRKFRILGGDMVGMTLAPEVFLSRELEMCYASVCYLTNYAEGVEDRDYTEGELFEGMQNNHERDRVDKSILKFPEIIKRTFKRLAQVNKGCICKNAMGRYKRRGDIGEDWHTWIRS
ncbi:MAG: phosphorylase [Nitrospinae bacterium RIFCSPLOWO2_02_FULL_39_110]|nr:MAG: phosphorylase [Nitrospinae bacterium RIFCSPHIGHO2_02_39_11]OGV99618.1 MAG: phosphorylase [Nitrospinae bacterium RIFCSPHIGHO2_12_FULL_39_42]OGW01162.1 MAG: phosphorylase [Nitrospinae bacterium RIFCSPHIGHO2_02_FULL_39_82]OGW05307.1 MAG: phosphorylase [Nitrospinae bacterium RIFCSPLOWO2_02_FULL_39_110]OGW05550.1 MAG: phosphorylase [Nitrospinae bacterium RIFCSPLOWO2_02_39_17]OGW10084.1 MAG: phosphorylase [Nitrospinae bacterium RIFCSPLOWO2_12_FULL_39_93]OGW11018.1 MAG: phosphorylase [Nitros